MNKIAKDFNVQLLPYYKLRIENRSETVSVAVVDEESEIQVFYQFNAERIPVQIRDILGLPFRDVEVYLQPQTYAFIPSEVYVENDEDIYKSYFSDTNDSEVIWEKNDFLQLMIGYQWDTYMYQKWLKLFPDAIFKTALEPLFATVESHGLRDQNELYIDVVGHEMQVLFVSDGHFKFYSSFDIRNSHDLSYYILQVKNNFGLTHFEKIHVSGIDEQHPYFVRISDFGYDVKVLSGSLLLHHIQEECAL